MSAEYKSALCRRVLLGALALAIKKGEVKTPDEAWAASPFSKYTNEDWKEFAALIGDDDEYVLRCYDLLWEDVQALLGQAVPGMLES